SREISFTVVSMTLSLVAVFIPILFMGGVVGRLFSEFAITIAIAILISGIVALTLTPMLSGRLLRPPATHGRFYRITEHAYERVRSAYVESLGWAIRHWRLTLGFAVVILAFSAMLFMVIPKGFIPTEDTNVIYGHVRGPQGMSYQKMLPRQNELVQKVLATPGVDGVMSSVGQGRGASSNQSSGWMMIGLTPQGERSHNAAQIATQLRSKADHLPDLEAF